MNNLTSPDPKAITQAKHFNIQLIQYVLIFNKLDGYLC